MDVFIPEEYVIKRRMERMAAAAAEGSRSWSRSETSSSSSGKQVANNNQGQSISWVDHRSDNFLHSCCF
uniref:Uncharacterized protein n=1 Tax=Chenopodium quinoa TaxID=63459 RepID=A0A803LQM3_CHEQI